MSTITNRYANIELWNLDPGAEKRGPFMVVQCGAAPGDELTNEQMFLLRHDGKWVNVLGFDSTGEARELDELIFDTPRQCLQLLRRLRDLAEVPDVWSAEKKVRRGPSRAASMNPFLKIYRLSENYWHGRPTRNADSPAVM